MSQSHQGEQRYIFPNPENADRHGLVCATTTFTADMVLSGYRQGIYPWTENPVRWYSPNPRGIFWRTMVKPPRRLSRMMRKGMFRVTCDTAFDAVIEACAKIHGKEDSKGEGGTWITPGFLRVYKELHRRGYAHSVEVW